ncbi:sentrin-specific protease 7b isoform X2 [Genypterus blacodes]|uniref:sentrin-specific protease 7b isoform X2 n=1 Tax=Genypterus blacodes TaxID=154954 RepID=UPI003F75ACFA
MASPFKIPKKKQPAGDESSPLHMLSPLSRLQNSPAHIQSYWDEPRNGGADRMHSGHGLSSATHTQRSPPQFSAKVRTLLGLNQPRKAASAESSANQTAQGTWNSQSQHRTTGQPSSCFTNGWRPKRASDRLTETLEPLSPPMKRSTSDFTAQPNRNISVKSVDLLAKLRDEEHPGNFSSSFSPENTWRQDESRRDGTKWDSPERAWTKCDHLIKTPSPGASSDQDFVSPTKTRNKTSGDTFLSSNSQKQPVSLSYVVSTTLSPSQRQDRSLNRTPLLSTSRDLRDDQRETERQRWREFKERRTYSRSLSVHQRMKRPKQTKSSSEPIVLSSEEEEESEDEGGGEKKGAESSHALEEDLVLKNQKSEQKQGDQAGKPLPVPRAAGGGEEWPLPPFLQLDFISLHTGLTCVDANGKIKITENGISLPLKGVEEGDVTTVASQVRGYGLWDGAVAQDGTLLADWEGPAPSLLFLWLTDAQARMLHRELSVIQPAMASDPWCCFLLLVLKEQLQELQAALLSSILDMEEYRKGYTSSSCSGGPCSSVDWAEGLLLLHSCPPPMDQHLLRLLGHCRKQSPSKPIRGHRPSSSLQQFPSRLIQYPAPPCKGRITVTKEDLDCLDNGEFLNDVIIDFYLKYLLLEGVGGAVAERSHVFSSFFFKQLSRRRAAGEDDAPSVPDRHTRHQRVKTWTRHVDIFTKDFLFVPVNQEAHWYLVVVCFPGLEEAQYEEFQSPVQEHNSRQKSPAEREEGKRVLGLRSQQPPECTQQGWKKDTVVKRPCILVMDSLKLSYHENVCKLLRDYLQVEWEVRRGTPRLFTPDSTRSTNCRVPLQDNSSDCGLYLLQYVESFLKNPVVNFDLPLRLDNWFLRQQVRQKRREIRDLVMKLHEGQH